MTPRFEVIEVVIFQEWAIEATWADGRKQQLVGMYTSEDAAKESLPLAAEHFLADLKSGRHS